MSSYDPTNPIRPTQQYPSLFNSSTIVQFEYYGMCNNGEFAGTKLISIDIVEQDPDKKKTRCVQVFLPVDQMMSLLHEAVNLTVKAGQL